MASPPVFTLTDDNNRAINNLNFGVVDAGSENAGIYIRIWNNISGATNISDAINPTITTKTANGYDGAPDGVSNGSEIVQNKYIQVQNVSGGSQTFLAMGGPTVQSISDSPPQSGNSAPPPAIHSGQYARLLLRPVIPTNATATNAGFLLRVAYQYQ